MVDKKEKDPEKSEENKSVNSSDNIIDYSKFLMPMYNIKTDYDFNLPLLCTILLTNESNSKIEQLKIEISEKENEIKKLLAENKDISEEKWCLSPHGDFVKEAVSLFSWCLCVRQSLSPKRCQAPFFIFLEVKS
ncbi:MAG: hypothetical protein LBM77_08090 [Spirochaetaceae bacterium]|jgi:hypothetical protein|nr:hypothetical protein [Spirochaetaceae bacterium]